MIQVRKAHERGRANFGWLDSNHTFSFGQYYDPAHMGFRKLRVINEDRVVPGAGFGTHPHRDMEIVSYVVEGALEHKDSMGNSSIIRPGEIQRMSAGSGVTHSEYNHSNSEGVHFLQIWIETAQRGMQPSYEQKNFKDDMKPGELRLIASRDGSDTGIRIYQDVNIYAGLLSTGQSISYEAPTSRYTWIQMVKGEVTVNGERLEQGDGVAISNVSDISIEASKSAEFLVFDLA
jgi:redox-sensitive bicupin YhaK (pirin superfamily)